MTPLAVFLIAFFAGCLTGLGVHRWNRNRGTPMMPD
jgi:hypothetical protein